MLWIFWKLKFFKTKILFYGQSKNLLCIHVRSHKKNWTQSVKSFWCFIRYKRTSKVYKYIKIINIDYRMNVSSIWFNAIFSTGCNVRECGLFGLKEAEKNIRYLSGLGCMIYKNWTSYLMSLSFLKIKIIRGVFRAPLA